jgi:adenosylcobinamide-GDP ribazoletransferase
MRRALAFLTPLGRGEPPTVTTFDWFPVAGALLGLAVGGVWWAAGEVWPAIVAAGVAVAADLALTGLLHVDGVADTADGLLPHLPRERRLAVMAAPDVGAYGVAALVGVLLLRFGAFASLSPEPLVVAGLWCASRTAMAAAARSLPYAGGGVAAPFLGRSPVPVGMGGAVLAVVLCVAGDGVSGAAAVAAVAAGAAVVLVASMRRLGGFTGDVLGAAGVVGETLGLLVVAARW